jgi:cyanophycinase
MGAPLEAVADQSLRQWLLREAGGFGARMILLTVETAHVETVATLRAQLEGWECEQVVEIVALDRQAARNTDHVAPVEQATEVVMVGDDPLRWATILGGTPLAQAVRRANARSKLVAGIGAVSAFLPQHIISPGTRPQTLRGAVEFGPGLGLLNRLIVDAIGANSNPTGESQRRLLAAVATNPFLVGVALNAGGAAILYSDNTLHASGPNPLTIVDGQAIEAADLDAAGTDAIVGALHYTLRTGDGFNLDDHTFRPAGEIDLPSTGPVTSVF